MLLLCVLAVCTALRASGQEPSPESAVGSLLAQGSTAIERGDLTAAENDFQRAVAAAPQQSEAHFGLGMVELRKGALDSAMVSLKRAIELNPKLGGAHLFLGIAEAQVGQSDAALDNLRTELALNPDNVAALNWLGIVALGNGQPEQAAAAFDHAVALQPTDPQLLYYDARAHAQVAHTVLQKLYKLDPDSALVHRALAEDLADNGQPEKAIAEYQKALAKQPDSADLLEAMAEQEQKLSRFDDAVKTYQQELAINPNSAIAMYNLGKMDVEHGQPQQGVALLRKAAVGQAAPAPADFYLGFGLAELGRNEEAAHWLEQSLSSQPSPFIQQSAYFQLARVYQRLDRKADAQKAIDELKLLKARNSPGTDAADGTTDSQPANQPQTPHPPK